MKKMLIICSAVMLCAALHGCRSARGGAAPEQTAATTAEQTTAQTTASTTKETTTTTQTTQSTTVSSETTSDTTDTTGSETTASGTATTAALNPDGKAIKILWSERGLEAAVGDSYDGYGVPLTEGAEYLKWKLEHYDGNVSGDKVASLDAEFSRSAPLEANGIMTVLPSANTEHPGKLCLRVDNQSDFPYFPADTRERGYFVIENTDEVWEMLKEEKQTGDVSIAVTLFIDKLTVHYGYGGTRKDTITVTSASKR